MGFFCETDLSRASVYDDQTIQICRTTAHNSRVKFTQALTNSLSGVNKLTLHSAALEAMCLVNPVHFFHRKEYGIYYRTDKDIFRSVYQFSEPKYKLCQFLTTRIFTVKFFFSKYIYTFKNQQKQHQIRGQYSSICYFNKHEFIKIIISLNLEHPS